jgi:hypothetical protein
VASFRFKVFNRSPPYRDKEVVGVFVRFSCATFHDDVVLEEQLDAPASPLRSTRSRDAPTTYRRSTNPFSQTASWTTYGSAEP